MTPTASRGSSLEVLAKVDLPCCCHRVVVRRVYAVKVVCSVPDHVQRAITSRGAPGKDSRFRLSLVDLEGAGPRLSEGLGEAVEDVVVVAVNHVDISSDVNAHVDELVAIVKAGVRVVVHYVVSESQTSIGGYGYPNCVNMAEDCALSQLCSTRNRAEHLVNRMVPWVYGQVADHVVEPGQESHVGWVKRVSRLGESGPAVQAARDKDIVGRRNSMVGHAHFVSPIGSDPLPVINWNASSGWVENPRAASVSARGYVNIR